MTRLLVLYGTTDGHTAKVAHVLGEEFRRLGAAVDVAPAATENPDPAGYDGVAVAASVVMGHYQRPVRRWVRAHHGTLAARPTAFLSVCLGILQDSAEVNLDLARIAQRFFVRSGWTPDGIEFVAGALPYTRYGWLKRLVMRRIARKTGGATDTSRDHEYTDWNDLRGFAQDFFAGLRPAAAPERAMEPTGR